MHIQTVFITVEKMFTIKKGAGMMKKFFLLAVILATQPLHSAIVPLGSGSYTTALPSGQKGPSDQNGNPATPAVSASFSKPITTHKWWSSLIWRFNPQDTYSQNLFIQPLSALAQSNGLQIGYSTIPAITPQVPTAMGWKSQEYHYNFEHDLTVGLANLASPDTKVDDYSDWAVTALWQDSTHTLRITMVQGCPFIYCITSAGATAQIACAGTPTIWYQSNEVIGLTINNNNYGIFAPRGSSWQGKGTLQSTLNGKQYFSVALLPDNTVNTLLYFAQHAYAFVTNTQVSWQYNQPLAELNTIYTLTTTQMDSSAGLSTVPLIALFRHQWLHTAAPLTSYTYIGPRGVMKVIEANQFGTSMTFNGILPTLPLVAQNGIDSFSSSQLYSYVNQIYQQPYLQRWSNLATDESYLTGKAVGRIAQLILIAQQVGHTAAQALFLSELKQKLQEWYSASDGDYRLYYYDTLWQSVIGYPADFGSDTQLNDHHFHYGYYIMASAVVALFDPVWAQLSQWGAMVQLLIQDVANWNRANTQFPFLRHFNIYEGHSYASGPAMFGAGNNQESSSEAINCAGGIFLWGCATQNNTIRDLGIYLYTTESEAIKNYWFDVDQAVFPSGFTKPTLGILWSNGGSYAIWWEGTAEEVHGINFLPITASSLHLGQYPSYLQRNQAYMLANNPQPTVWRDIHMSVQALYNSTAAIAQFNANQNYAPEAGDSPAHTYYWIHNIDAMGEVDTTVTASVPSYAVFTKNGNRTYTAYNYSASPITVTFSDGKTLNVPAQSFGSSATSVNPPPPPPPSPDFTQTFTITGTNSVFVQFIPNSPATFVDFHYLVNGANQQNVRMNLSNGIWSWTINNVPQGATITYFFTYTKKGLAYNSPWSTWVF